MCFTLSEGSCSPAAAQGAAAAEGALAAGAALCLHSGSLSFPKRAGDGAPAHPNCCYPIPPSFFQYHPKCGPSDKTTINKGKLAKKKSLLMLCISTALPVRLLFFSMFNKVKQQFNPAAGQRSAVIKAVPLSLAPWAHSPDWNNHGLVLSPLKLVLAVIHLMNMQ